ncbi:MAG: class IV adenylate cyclase [Acidobacteria bacterium]|nr:class IV adenylate cyclase [Acidobacteriota bacterium]
METEIKFRIRDLSALPPLLRRCGFREETPRTKEVNELYDLPGQALRKRGALLRLRQYGERWVLTYKEGRPKPEERHKSRREIETVIAEGSAMEGILQALGYEVIFRYEKFRSEWSDGVGHVVIDETPIGNFAEIEGSPEWIDATAARLGVSPGEYITRSYADLWFRWKEETGSRARHMTFAEVANPAKAEWLHG